MLDGPQRRRVAVLRRGRVRVLGREPVVDRHDDRAGLVRRSSCTTTRDCCGSPVTKPPPWKFTTSGSGSPTPCTRAVDARPGSPPTVVSSTSTPRWVRPMMSGGTGHPDQLLAARRVRPRSRPGGSCNTGVPPTRDSTAHSNRIGTGIATSVLLAVRSAFASTCATRSAGTPHGCVDADLLVEVPQHACLVTMRQRSTRRRRCGRAARQASSTAAPPPPSGW